MKHGIQCNHYCEERTTGKRYVNNRWRCGNRASYFVDYGPYGYCWRHVPDDVKAQNRRKPRVNKMFVPISAIDKYFSEQ